MASMKNDARAVVLEGLRQSHPFEGDPGDLPVQCLSGLRHFLNHRGAADSAVKLSACFDPGVKTLDPGQEEFRRRTRRLFFAYKAVIRK